MENITLQEKTAIQNEQQSKTADEIIKDIINLLISNNDMSFHYGKEILLETIRALGRTPFNHE